MVYSRDRIDRGLVDWKKYNQTWQNFDTNWFTKLLFREIKHRQKKVHIVGACCHSCFEGRGFKGQSNMGRGSDRSSNTWVTIPKESQLSQHVSRFSRHSLSSTSVLWAKKILEYQPSTHLQAMQYAANCTWLNPSSWKKNGAPDAEGQALGAPPLAEMAQIGHYGHWSKSL